MSDISELARRIKRLRSRLATTKTHKNYADDPVGYAHDILKIEHLTPDQIEIADKLRTYPYRVMAKSGHKTGKSMTAGWLINWFYDSFAPSQCIQTAPTLESVKDIVWKEVRVRRMAAGLGADLQPKAPAMSDAPDHFAKGLTASTGEAFHGRHGLRSFYLFDEGCGIDPVFWSVTRSMFKPEPGHMWLVLLNPTDTTSQAFIEDHSTDENGNPTWHSVVMDCLRHPNVVAQLDGRDPPIPAAVTLPQVNEWVQSWCDPIPAGEAKATDLEWPPKSGRWYRQGPEFQARCRGMWPEGGTYSVWSEVLWRSCESAIFTPPNDQLPEIGLDVARFGDDYTAFHVRWGNASYHHEAQNGWSTVRTVARVIELCEEYAALATSHRQSGAAPIRPNQIAIKVDDDGVGGGVTDILQSRGYFVVPVSANSKSLTGRYPNKRCELWFQVAERARAGLLGLARIPSAAKNRMRQQAMAVSWMLNAMGQRIVEPKDVTKEKIGRSPDDMDAMNLAYLSGFDLGVAQYVQTVASPPDPWSAPDRGKRKIFGA